MSLTSYRAAPPRVLQATGTVVLYAQLLQSCRDSVTALAVMPVPEQIPLGFVSCKGRTVSVCDRLPQYFRPIIAERTALGGPFVSAWAVFRSEKIVCCV